MMIPPRTPQIEKQPLFFVRYAVSENGRGQKCAKPWIYSILLYKSLIAERIAPASQLDLSTGCVDLSTGCHFYSTHGFFNQFINLSIYLLLLKERKKKRVVVEKKMMNPRVGTTAYFFIHGLELLPALTRGNSWIGNCIYFNGLGCKSDLSTHPRFVLRVGNLGVSYGC